jgi:hypothetical protein
VPERVAVDRVAIAEEVRRRGVVREGVHDLLGRPGGGGMFRHVEVEDTPAMVGEDEKDEEDWCLTVGTMKKSQEIISAA